MPPTCLRSPARPRRKFDPRRLAEERARDVVPLAGHDLQLSGCFCKRDGDDVVPSQRGHLPELAAECEICRLEPEPRREHAIPRRGGAAPLHVAEHRDARLEAGALLDLPPERVADAAPREDHVPELVLLPGIREAGELAPLADDDDGEVLAVRMPLPDPPRDP